MARAVPRHRGGGTMIAVGRTDHRTTIETITIGMMTTADDDDAEITMITIGIITIGIEPMTVVEEITPIKSMSMTILLAVTGVAARRVAVAEAVRAGAAAAVVAIESRNGRDNRTATIP